MPRSALGLPLRPQREPEGPRHAWLRLIGVWFAAMAVAAVALKVLDHVPTLLAGAPRGVRVYESVEDAERALGFRVWLPGYYPDELGWPPSSVEASISQHPSVAVRLPGREGRGDRLVVVQSLEPAAAPPPRLLPPGEIMERTQVTVGARPASLVRLLVGTRELHDLSWDQDGRRVTLRYAGPVERLLLMADSLARRRTN